MEKVITDNLVETIKVKYDEHTVFIVRTRVESGTNAILLNKREAEELHKFLGEWLK